MDIQAVKQKFGIIGNDETLNRAIEVALRVAPTDLSVLITGESGVGKEFFPKIIHSNSPRKHGNYIAVNCGAIPEGTIDSELFGHEKGSFTGASESRKGYFEVADNGTIFLDEVGELPLSTQVRLLRVLQTGEIIRVGSSKSSKVNVRVVAATNSDLLIDMQRGKFREDLYYRLNTVPIYVPSLRERKEDIFLLFRKFAVDVAEMYRMPPISLDADARHVLTNYSWPGNIRQLKNVAEQISAVEEARLITGPLIQRYLPNYMASAVPAVKIAENHADTSSDREILYKILFDMRSEVHDLRQMVLDLVSAQRGYAPKVETTTALVPANFGMPAKFQTPPVAAPVSEDFAEMEELSADPPEITKEQAQRDAILRALRKHNGKRKEAARELFISERTLYRKIKELDIEGF